MQEIFALYNLEAHYSAQYIPFPRLPIAYIELIAVLVGFSVFAGNHRNELITIYSDNTDVVSWLRKSRCTAGIGFKLLAAIEFFKREYQLKISARHIPGRHNNTADSLSRGTVPHWLSEHGCRQDVDIKTIYDLIRSPLHFWTVSTASD